VLFICVLVMVFTEKFNKKVNEIEKEYKNMFNDFLTEYRKDYIFSQNEYEKRLRLFKNNLNKIYLFQLSDPTAEYGITEFTDMEEDEFRSRFLNLKDEGITHPPIWVRGEIRFP